MSSESVIGVSGVEEDVLRCEWTVKDFDELQALNNRCITSPDFAGKRNAWYFLLDPNRNWVSVNLKDYEKVKKEFRAKTVFEILDLQNNQKWTSDEETATYGNGYFYRSLSLRSEAKQLMHSANGFKIVCIVTEMTEMSTICLPINTFNTNDSLCEFTKSMINCDQFSDVMIASNDGRVFNAHKFMISRSPVFKQMLLSNLIESNTSMIQIDDLSGDALEKMLRFIYSDEVLDDDSIDCEYLLAAHKYDLPLLTAKYGASLAKKANIENCIHLLILGEMTDCDELREPLLNFVALNRKEISATNGWLLLAKERPELLAKVVSMC
ncbi:Speckle-type POZ protein B-like protein [Leptotrombidium deliense]|uniref:Speckle-type POZ protein B-like protein n=1 Tax=Leptotrombidium deliense TaxID=299467 RepID=A0A443S800_9ACAR|nr:Speckle-type POZ protein B-like protein [Leptotrombidium deliense]